MKKMSFIATSLLFASMAFSSEITCYKLAEKSNNPTAPARLCLTDIGVYNNGDTEWVEVYGGNMAGSYNLVNSFQDVLAQKEVSRTDDSICGYEKIETISIKLDSKSNVMNAKKLKVSFITEDYRDSCHSYPDYESVSYELEK